MNKVKIYCTRPQWANTYKNIGFFRFYILPSIQINKDDVFEENLFNIDFNWLFWDFSICFDKKKS